jgi:hypothetical protein
LRHAGDVEAVHAAFADRGQRLAEPRTARGDVDAGAVSGVGAGGGDPLAVRAGVDRLAGGDRDGADGVCWSFDSTTSTRPAW